MPLRELRIQNYRPFADSGVIRIAPCSGIVGRNDAGKSGLLSALNTFFNPPKKGIAASDIHMGDLSKNVTIEAAFDPLALQSRQLKVDANNEIDLIDDCLVDAKGLLRLRATMSNKRVEKLEILIHDVDDGVMHPIALKSQDQLLTLLEVYDLQAVRAGPQTNAEKRQLLRKAAVEKGVACAERWYDADEIEAALRAVLPEFVYFTDTSNYAIDETVVQNQFRLVVERAIAQHPSAGTIEQEMKALIQAEFDKVFERLTLLTDAVTGLTAEPRVSWKKAIDGVGLLWQDQSGFTASYARRGAGIRRLFMVAYFQYEAAASLYEAKGTKYVFAIEEPEIHLHPGAQRLLLESFSALTERGHTIVFTTHSPVFAASTPLEGITLVQRDASDSHTVQVPRLDLALIAQELGVEAPDRLIGRNYVILVEGPRDVEFYATLLKEIHAAGHTALDPSKVMFLQCGGVETMRFAVASRCMDEAGLKWAVLADSDRQAKADPEGRAVAALRAAKPATCLAIEVLERTSIENYLEAAAIKTVAEVDCVAQDYGRHLDPQGHVLKDRVWNVIKHASPHVAKQMGANGLIARATRKDGSCEWIDLFDRLRVAFGL